MPRFVARVSWFALIMLLASACTKAPPLENKDTLKPGGTYVSADGVVLGAPDGALEAPVDVTVRVVEAPPDVPLPAGTQALGEYYRLSASQDTFSLHDPFVVALPVPDGADSNSLALAVLLEPEDMTDVDLAGPKWQLLEGAFDPNGSYFVSSLALLASEGRVVMLVSADGYLSPSFSAAPVLRSQQASGAFSVRCRDFDAAGNNRAIECASSDEADLETVLAGAFSDYTGLGFAAPYLTRLIDYEASIFNLLSMNIKIVYGDYLAELRPFRDVPDDDLWPCGVSSDGTKNLGGYSSSSRSFFVCIGPAGVTASASGTARHEYFHATQYAYAAVRSSNQSWVKESTASASEDSLAGMARDVSRDTRSVMEPLTAVDPGTIEYRTQDFFVYAGLVLGRGLDYLIDVFQEGASTTGVDRGLTVLGLSGGLSELYWDWVKNQAFEKAVDIGGGVLGASCTYSPGSGSLTTIDYQHVAPPSDRSIALAPLTSTVVRLRLEALPDVAYSTQLQAGTTGAGTNDDVRVKYYDAASAGTTNCRTGAESDSLAVTVSAGRPHTYHVLISNTSITDYAHVVLGFGAESPAVEVLNPTSGATFTEGEPIEFLAVATGFKRASPGTIHIGWTYPRYDGVPFTFGSNSGEAVYRDQFCDGTYTVTVKAVDAATSRSATETVTFTVVNAFPPPPHCAPTVEIITPADGARFASGASIDFEAVFDDDHPESADPIHPITWYDGGPEGLVIARNTLTFSRDKFAVGIHEIYVEYGSANHSVTIEVIDTTNTAPTATITTPADGASFSWDTSSPLLYLEVDFSGAGIDAEDGALSGAGLTWRVRENAAATWSEADPGAQITQRFNYSCQTNKAYVIQLMATDSEGLFDVDQIEIFIVSPPC